MNLNTNILALVGKADKKKNAPSKREKEGTKREDPKYEPEEQNPKVGGSLKGPKEQRMFKSFKKRLDLGILEIKVS